MTDSLMGCVANSNNTSSASSGTYACGMRQTQMKLRQPTRPGGGSFSNTDFGSFSNTDVLDHFRTQSGPFSNTWGGYPAAPVGWGGGGGWGGAVAFASYCVPVQLRPGGGNQEAPSPKLSWLFEQRCPRRLALVGPRKAVKARPNGRNNSREGRYYSVKKPRKLVKCQCSELSCPRDTKNLLNSYGLSNLRIGASWNCDRRLLRGGATAYWGWGGGVGWGSCVRFLLRDRATASWGGGGWGGAVTFASYCVTVRLRAGGDGGVVGSDDDDVDDDGHNDDDDDYVMLTMLLMMMMMMTVMMLIMMVMMMMILMLPMRMSMAMTLMMSMMMVMSTLMLIMVMMLLIMMMMVMMFMLTMLMIILTMVMLMMIMMMMVMMMVMMMTMVMTVMLTVLLMMMMM